MGQLKIREHSRSYFQHTSLLHGTSILFTQKERQLRPGCYTSYYSTHQREVTCQPGKMCLPKVPQGTISEEREENIPVI